MRIFKNLVDFYIESSLHVAIALYALIRITFLKLDIPYDEAVTHFGFFGTIVGYNFIKYDELARIKKIKLTFRLKAIIALSILSFFAAFYYFLELHSQTKFVGFIALFITILYTLPFIPNRGNMRNWSGIKIYLVAIAWVGVTVILPVINADYDWNIIVILKCIQRFIFIILLMLIFEIIDLKVNHWHLKTIPQQLGMHKTKILTYLLSFIFVSLDFAKPDITIQNLLTTLSIAIIICLFSFFASTKRNKYYTSFWVESIPLFWWLLCLF